MLQGAENLTLYATLGKYTIIKINHTTFRLLKFSVEKIDRKEFRILIFTLIYAGNAIKLRLLSPLINEIKISVRL